MKDFIQIIIIGIFNQNAVNGPKKYKLVADCPKNNTFLFIHNNREGQTPEAFERTLLSLMSGNKNEFPFVHEKYNMGRSRAIIFCGKNGYQLIGSKRYKEIEEFGLT